MHRPSGQVLGLPQLPVHITPAAAAAALGLSAGTTAPMPVAGEILRASDLHWGEGDFMLAFGVAGLAAGDIVLLRDRHATARAVAGARGLAAVSMSANTDPAALSWFCIRGYVPARVTGGTINLPVYQTATAGSGSTTVVAGDQVTGAVIALAPSTTVLTKTNCKTETGVAELQVPDFNGLYEGQLVTGTGIPAGTSIVNLGWGGTYYGSANGTSPRTVKLSAAATANGQITATFAHSATFATVAVNRPVASGLG